MRNRPIPKIPREFPSYQHTGKTDRQNGGENNTTAESGRDN